LGEQLYRRTKNFYLPWQHALSINAIPNFIIMKQRFGKHFYLIPAGLFITALSLILFRFIAAPDPVKGLSIGVGIGLMLIPFIKRYKHSANT
jgi:hypothetical protein